MAWQKGVDLAVEIDRVCGNFPRHEQFGLSRQMRNAAVSVPSNIAEGRGRGTIPDYRRFVLQARGSSYELETQIEIAKRLGYMGEAEATNLSENVNEIQRLIHGLIRSLDAQV